MGHAHPDLDSLASAYVAAHWLGGRAVVARAVDPHTESIWKALGGPELPVVFEADRVLLVDCQEPDVPCAQVTGIIDHHPPFEPREKGLYLFGEVGATATLIAESAADLGKTERRLLAAAILSDTKALKSSRTTPRDKKALQGLYRTWQKLIPLAMPGAQGLPPEMLRTLNVKKFGDVRWSSAEGWGPPPDLWRIGEGTTGPFLFTWTDLKNERTVTALYEDGRQVFRRSEGGIISRRHMEPWLEAILVRERGRRPSQAGGKREA